jgi:hypothetical protein
MFERRSAVAIEVKEKGKEDIQRWRKNKAVQVASIIKDEIGVQEDTNQHG